MNCGCEYECSCGWQKAMTQMRDDRNARFEKLVMERLMKDTNITKDSVNELVKDQIEKSDVLNTLDYKAVKTSEEKPASLGTNPKDRLGAKKVMLNLVPASSTIYQALAMEDGARKYGPYNWRENKVIASIYVAACKRHLDAWFDSREELAADSQRPHLGHAIACLGILIDAYETGNLVDDRPPAGAASALIAKWEKK